MKRLMGIFLVFLGILVILIAVCYGVYGRSFTLSNTSEEEFTIELPLQSVALNLMMSNVSDKISERLGITILKKELVEKSGEISIAAFLSGNWNICKVEESDCVLHNPDLGKVQLKIRTTTTATPEKVLVRTNLVSPVGVIKEVTQVITITPKTSASGEPEKKKPAGLLSAVFGKAEGATTISVGYTTAVEINWPGVPFLRAEAEKRFIRTHEKTVKTIIDTLKETAVHPSFRLSTEATSTRDTPQPVVESSVPPTETATKEETVFEESSEESLPFDAL